MQVRMALSRRGERKIGRIEPEEKDEVIQRAQTAPLTALTPMLIQVNLLLNLTSGFLSIHSNFSKVKKVKVGRRRREG